MATVGTVVWRGRSGDMDGDGRRMVATVGGWYGASREDGMATVGRMAVTVRRMMAAFGRMVATSKTMVAARTEMSPNLSRSPVTPSRARLERLEGCICADMKAHQADKKTKATKTHISAAYTGEAARAAGLSRIQQD